ncbi:MAG: VOC family protein [Henriciella sp.]
MVRQLAFGPPMGGIMQVAYVVSDLESAADYWVRNLNIGPWMIMEHFPAENMTYRGNPTSVDLSIALAFSGSICFELIFQHNDVPSVYKEIGPPTVAGKFHHWAVGTESFDEDVNKHADLGNSVAFYGEVQPVGGLRFAYVDTFKSLGGMIELIEIGPPVEELFAGVKAASEAWDGHTVCVWPE